MLYSKKLFPNCSQDHLPKGSLLSLPPLCTCVLMANRTRGKKAPHNWLFEQGLCMDWGAPCLPRVSGFCLFVVCFNQVIHTWALSIYFLSLFSLFYFIFSLHLSKGTDMVCRQFKLLCQHHSLTLAKSPLPCFKTVQQKMVIFISCNNSSMAGTS